MSADETLWCSLDLRADHAGTFPGLRPVPRKSASGFLGSASLFVLRTADEPQRQDAAQGQTNQTHELLVDRLVDNVVPGRNRRALWHAIADDVCDGRRGLYGGHTNLADVLRAAFDEKLSVIHNPVLVAQAEDDEVPRRIDGQHSPG